MLQAYFESYRYVLIMDKAAYIVTSRQCVSVQMHLEQLLVSYLCVVCQYRCEEHQFSFACLAAKSELLRMTFTLHSDCALDI